MASLPMPTPPGCSNSVKDTLEQMGEYLVKATLSLFSLLVLTDITDFTNTYVRHI